MTFRGGFDQFDAKLQDGRLEGLAKVASVRVDDPTLAGHLQTPDFFDAEQFPELRFVSKSIERDGDLVSIDGELTLRGATSAVELSGTVTGPITDGYATSAWASTSRLPSIAATTGSTGAWSSRAASPALPTTS